MCAAYTPRNNTKHGALEEDSYQQEEGQPMLESFHLSRTGRWSKLGYLRHINKKGRTVHDSLKSGTLHTATNLSSATCWVVVLKNVHWQERKSSIVRKPLLATFEIKNIQPLSGQADIVLSYSAWLNEGLVHAV